MLTVVPRGRQLPSAPPGVNGDEIPGGRPLKTLGFPRCLAGLCQSAGELVAKAQVCHSTERPSPEGKSLQSGSAFNQPSPRNHPGHRGARRRRWMFAFGEARFFGSTGTLPLANPVVSIAATGDGNRYWLVASEGGIFAFRDAGLHGSTGGIALAKPVVSMAATGSRNGLVSLSDIDGNHNVMFRHLARHFPVDVDIEAASNP